jgi:tetratricopeptide (TPR) repeat protein
MAYAKTSLRAEKRALREKMRAMGTSYREISAEFARRYKLRPRTAWREAYGWSLKEAAERINSHSGQVGLDPGGIASMTAAHLCEYENWPGFGSKPSGRRPTPYLLALLAALYDCQVTDLIDLADREHLPAADLLVLDAYNQPRRSTTDQAQPVAKQLAPPSTQAMRTGEHLPLPETAGSYRVPDVRLPSVEVAGVQALPFTMWPSWFGTWLAQLITMTDNWHDPDQLGSLQSLLNQEILMSDAAVPHDQPQLTALHALSRRQALMTLAALPAALITPSAAAVGNPSPAAATELFLARCAASLASCWHLLRGSDLPAVQRTMSGYILPLDALAQQESKHQAVAARLATQAHRICGIIALHDKSVALSMHYCARALRCAAIAGDAGSHGSALISLASRYFYASNPQQAASLYEQASSFGAQLPELLRSRVRAELAVVYGQLGREQDAVRCARLAEDLYPDHPEDDPSFLYAEFTPASLVLEQGLAYLTLAGRFPSRSYQQKAADVFAQMRQPALDAPERIRFEVVNHQADTALLLGDLDAFETFMSRGLEGVAILGSRQRLKEMKATMLRAATQWPGDLRLKALGEGLRQVAGREDAA